MSANLTDIYVILSALLCNTVAYVCFNSLKKRLLVRAINGYVKQNVFICSTFIRDIYHGKKSSEFL